MWKNRGFLEKCGFPGVPVEKGGVLRGYGRKSGFLWKMTVFLKNEVFVGFWSRIRGKVGKSREFDDFWKIGKNREK